MIRFQCQCGKKMGVADSAVGKVAICPQCRSKVRVPPPFSKDPDAEEETPAKKRRHSAPPPEEDDAADDLDQEEAPRKRRGKKSRSSSSSKERRRREDEDDEEDWDDAGEQEKSKSGLTPNRIRGIIAIILGVAMLVGVLVMGKEGMPVEDYAQQYAFFAGLGFAVLFFGSGLFYVVKK